MTQIIASTKQGINVLTASDPNDFIFHSTYNSLKIIATGIYSVDAPSGTSNTYSFNHGLNYSPLVKGFCKVDNYPQAVCPGEGMDTSGFPFYHYFFHIGADDVKIYFRVYNGSASSHTYYLKYYIFEVPL